MNTTRATASLLIFALLAIEGCNLTEPEPEKRDPIYRIPITYFKTIDSYPAWSPGGRTIAYTHWPQTQEEAQFGADMQIWLLDMESEERRFVTLGWQPAWSPDGKRLAFVRGVLSDADVYTIDIASGLLTRVTEWGSCFDPSWAPDGKHIVYGNPTAGTPHSGVWIKSLDSGNHLEVYGQGWDPYWSPRGSQILFSAAPVAVKDGSSDEVAVADTTGQNLLQLTRDTRSDRHPSWSPDGAWITWDSYGEGNDPTSGIWIMRADGRGKRLLMYGGGFPSWSPDGKRIVFYKFFDEHTGGLWVMNADGTDARPLIPPEVYGLPTQMPTTRKR